MKSAAGDSVVLQAPRGTEYLTVLNVCYERISVDRSVNHLERRPRQRAHSPTPIHQTKVSVTAHEIPPERVTRDLEVDIRSEPRA
jgi:hypothetical protein